MVILLEYLASKKLGIRKVDLTMKYMTKKFGYWIILPLAIAAPIAFPMFAGTYYFLGAEHVFLWVPVIGFWILSNIRIILYQILMIKKKR